MSTTAGSTKTKNNLVFKDRYRGTAFKPENVMGYDPDVFYTNGDQDPEKYDNFRLHEFRMGNGKFMEAVDYKRALDSSKLSVFGWFRIPPSDGIIHLVQKYGHTEPRSEGLTAELKPGQKLFSFMSLKNVLTLNLYDKFGAQSQTASVRDETVRDGQWHQIGFSVEPSGICIFVDGLRILHQRTGAGIPTNVYPATFSVGSSSDATFFVSNVTYSVEPMDPIKASAMYNNGQPSDPKILISGLRAWYPFQSNRAVDLMNNAPGVISSGPARQNRKQEKARGKTEMQQMQEIQSMGRFVKKVATPHSFVA